MKFFRYALRARALQKDITGTTRYFGVTTNAGKFVLVDWSLYGSTVSPAQTFVDLDRAASIEQAMISLARFPGPTHNFVLADTTGRAAYQLAGPVPNDPVWSRWFHPASDLGKQYETIPFASMPHVSPSKDAILWTANNKIYGSARAARLSPQFAAPYRAYRIAQLLRARKKYDVAYFTRIQMDALSLPERELVQHLGKTLRGIDPRAAAALASWNGEMTGDSVEATVAQALRVELTQQRRAARCPLLASRSP